MSSHEMDVMNLDACHEFWWKLSWLSFSCFQKVSWSWFPEFRFIKKSSCTPLHEPVFHHFSSPHFCRFSWRYFDKFLPNFILVIFLQILFSFILFIFYSFRPKFSKFSKVSPRKTLLIPTRAKALAVGRSQARSLHVMSLLPTLSQPPAPCLLSCATSTCRFHKSSYVVIIVSGCDIWHITTCRSW